MKASRTESLQKLITLSRVAVGDRPTARQPRRNVAFRGIIELSSSSANRSVKRRLQDLKCVQNFEHAKSIAGSGSFTESGFIILRCCMRPCIMVANGHVQSGKVRGVAQFYDWRISLALAGVSGRFRVFGDLRISCPAGFRSCRGRKSSNFSSNERAEESRKLARNKSLIKTALDPP